MSDETHTADVAGQAERRIEVRPHITSQQHGLDRVKLSIQMGPLGSFNRADGERIAWLWNEAATTLEARAAEIAQLKAALRRHGTAWENLLDMQIIPHRHEATCRELADQAHHLTRTQNHG